MLKKVDLTKTRVCTICGEEFLPSKALRSCRKCTNEKARLNRIKYKAQGKIQADKENYPFDNRTNEAGARFCKIRTALSNAWKEYHKTGDKSYVLAHYDKQLTEAKELGILEWIWDRRTQNGKGNGRRGRPTNDIREEYPSTMNMPY